MNANTKGNYSEGDHVNRVANALCYGCMRDCIGDRGLDVCGGLCEGGGDRER